MNLNVNDFVALVTEWANANVDRIGTVWPLDGGWEAWAQAEIAGYINARAPDTWLRREVRVYSNGGRCDFLVNDPFTNDNRDEIVVEMKCESLNNWAAFVDGLRADTYKLSDPYMDYRTGSKISFGIFVTTESEQQLAMLQGYTLSYTNDGQIGLAFLTWQDGMAAETLGQQRAAPGLGKRVGRVA